MDLLQHNYCKW